MKRTLSTCPLWKRKGSASPDCHRMASSSRSSSWPGIRGSSELGVDALGGTMRLGKYPCTLKEGSLAHEAYGVEQIEERHRHRYEANPEYMPALEEKGFRITGLSPDGKFVEIIELAGHPWFVRARSRCPWRHHASRKIPLHAERRLAGPRSVRSGTDRGTPSSSL